MVTTREACRILGIEERGFRKLRARVGGIVGAVQSSGQWFFPREAIFKLTDGADQLTTDEETSYEEGLASMQREIVRGMETVVSQMRAVLGDVVGMVKPLASQITQAHTETNEAHKLALEAVSMVKDLMLEGGKMEAENVVKAADQQVRIERTKVAGKGLRLFMPIVKAGVSRWLGNPLLAKDAQAETVLELVRSLKDDKSGRLEKLMKILGQEQTVAVMELLGYAEGHEKLNESLKKLRGGMTEDKMQKLGELLSSREMTAVASLFEDDDDDEDAKTTTERKAS